MAEEWLLCFVELLVLHLNLIDMYYCPFLDHILEDDNWRMTAKVSGKPRSCTTASSSGDAQSRHTEIINFQRNSSIHRAITLEVALPKKKLFSFIYPFIRLYRRFSSTFFL
jgi:hypothetical protein